MYVDVGGQDTSKSWLSQVVSTLSGRCPSSLQQWLEPHTHQPDCSHLSLQGTFLWHHSFPLIHKELSLAQNLFHCHKVLLCELYLAFTLDGYDRCLVFLCGLQCFDHFISSRLTLSSAHSVVQHLGGNLSSLQGSTYMISMVYPLSFAWTCVWSVTGFYNFFHVQDSLIIFFLCSSPELWFGWHLGGISKLFVIKISSLDSWSPSGEVTSAALSQGQSIQ